MTTTKHAINYSIIVPAYNEARRLKSCLEALQKQTINRNNYEIIVVDDGSTDATASLALSLGVSCISQTNAGPATARNRGVEAAKGAIILFTDADCIATGNWLEEMVQPFNDASVKGVKGAYRSRQKELAARFAQAEFMDRYELLKRQPSIDMVDTHAAAFRRRTFIEMGGFDESFPVANNEDTDFSYRLSSAGKQLLFNPDAIVYHSHPKTLGHYLKIK
ncbi:MAG: glycosyltransferase, partial [Pseudomonadota bacterium]|nr:glycosyltransferase [Pseudomonadota bacterium]